MIKTMWKSLLIVWITLLIQPALAQDSFKCGEYEIKGVIRKVKGKNVIKLYEGSMSEVILSLAPDLEELAEVYQGKAVTLKGRLWNPVTKYRGFVDSRLSPQEIKDLTSPERPYTDRFMRDDIRDRVPDPLHPDFDSKLTLVKQMSCRGPSSKNK